MSGFRSEVSTGWRVYGLGVVAIGLVGLLSRDFILGQTVPAGLPGRAVLADVAALLMLAAGIAMEWRRTATFAATVLAVYLGLFVIVLMNGALLLKHYAEYGAYFGVAEQTSILAGALMVIAASSNLERGRALLLVRVGRIALGVCVVFFGGAHFVYMGMTAPLVPKWLPFSGVFWGYVTGVCFIAAGVALMTGVLARLAAMLLVVMLGMFALMVHVPALVAKRSVFNWTELVINFAIMGVAWVVADSLVWANAKEADPLRG